MDWNKATQGALGTIFGVFGTPVTYYPAAGGAIALRGVFEKGYKAVVLNGLETSTYAITLVIRLSDLSALPANGDRVTVDGVTYRVVKSEDDGQGASTLFLHKL